MKLKKITFLKVSALPGIRAGELSSFELENPPVALKDWRVVTRGASVFIVSPPGWRTDRTAGREKDGPITVYEFPRADVILHWIADPASKDDLENVFKGSKWESEPAGTKPPVPEEKSLLSQIPAGQLGDA